MNDLNDDNFDRMLHEHLSAELDGQLGRAPMAFERESRRWPWRKVMFSTIGLAAAAMLTIALIRPAPPVESGSQVALVKPIPTEYQLAWQTVDRGTVFLDDDTPAQSYLRRQVEVIRWVDPETQQPIEVRLPREELVLVGLRTF